MWSCQNCPFNSGKKKLLTCQPDSLLKFWDFYDERWVPYRVQTEGSCPTGAICSYTNITVYKNTGITCIPSEHRVKITGCQNCYRKAYMDPLCEYDVNACSNNP